MGGHEKVRKDINRNLTEEDKNPEEQSSKSLSRELMASQITNYKSCILRPRLKMLCKLTCKFRLYLLVRRLSRLEQF
jgi:hypothetical protein